MEPGTLFVIILLCIGAFQGIVFGIILTRRKVANVAANRFLAAILFFLSYRLLVQVLRLLGIGYYDTWYYFIVDLSWVNGALLYFYVRYQINPTYRFKPKDYLHFIPVLVQLAFSIFVRFQNFYWDGTRESLSWLGYWGYVVWMNNPTIYIVASVLIVLYSARAKKMLYDDRISVLKEEALVRLKRIVLSFQYYFLLVLFILVADVVVFSITRTNTSYFYFERFYYYPFFLGISLLTYWLGMEGFRWKDELLTTGKRRSTKQELKQLTQIAHQLKRVMEEEKLFREPELSVNSLSEKLDVKPYLLSRCLNEVLQKRFPDYINELRVLEVERLVNDPRNDHFTLLALAHDAGFNSKSSFNRSVKKFLGVSPAQLKSKN